MTLTNLSDFESFNSIKQGKHGKPSWVVMLKFRPRFYDKNYVGPVAQLVRAVDS